MLLHSLATSASHLTFGGHRLYFALFNLFPLYAQFSLLTQFLKPPSHLSYNGPQKADPLATPFGHGSAKTARSSASINRKPTGKMTPLNHRRPLAEAATHARDSIPGISLAETHQAVKGR